MKIWTWLTVEKNRKVLGWMGAGILAVVTYLGIGQKEEKSLPPVGTAPISTPAATVNANPQVTIAGGNGVAVNASGNATVNIKP